ncbi:MAG: hydrogenase maturation protease [Planctomycetota bacterium]|jgi:hydrogenase 3 maturation protease
MTEETRDESLASDLARRIEKPVVVIGVGSDLRGDDAFGVLAARELARTLGSSSEDIEVLEGGVAPENLAERAARNSPRTVVLIDAADFDGEPGELKLLVPEDLGWSLGGATHAPSLELLATYLKGRCGARTIMLAAQPASTEFGEGISPALEAAASRAAEALTVALAAL